MTDLPPGGIPSPELSPGGRPGRRAGIAARRPDAERSAGQPAPLSVSYRVQVTRDFPLAAATAIVPFLADLGVSHLYTSPLLASRPGSTHGYDVIDVERLDPERGTDDDLRALRDALRARGMGLILDIVPNHMACSGANPAWHDVLTHGPASPCARWFDIDWDAPGPNAGHVLLPVLAAPRFRCLSRGEIRLTATGGRLEVAYGEQRFPVEPITVGRVLARDDEPTLRDLATRLRILPTWRSPLPGDAELRRAGTAAAFAELAARHARSATVRSALDRVVTAAGARDAMEQILHAQPYRLVHWRRAAREVNYRRFFEVNDLIALRMEEPEVFAATHARVLSWVRDGLVDGLRIDHVDGLADPAGYLERLRAATGGGTPIWVEKILVGEERLPSTWPVAGTTGYDALAHLDALFIHPEGHARIARWYARDVYGADRDYPSTLRRAKRQVLEGSLRADVRRLARLLRRTAETDSLPIDEVRRTLVAVIAGFPVYRTYRTSAAPVPVAHDRAHLGRALAEAERNLGPGSRPSLAAVARALLGDFRGGDGARLEFVRRFQQTTGPAMAKGGEDTAFFRWVPLLSRNEVGGDPGMGPDGAIDRAHRFHADRQARWPHALGCLSTHDTKRSADLRARLDALSERADEWIDAVRRWQHRNAVHRTRLGRGWAPDRNTEYYLYQTLVGLWPLPTPGGPPAHDTGALESLRDRTGAHLVKAAREAKTWTSWVEPDAAFENALTAFVRGVLGDAGFVSELAALVARVVRPGLWSALGRCLLHCTAPGMPDLYQGDELWNFAVTDPDNRRPVDHAERRRLLAALPAAGCARPAFAASLADTPEDPRVKLHVVRQALAVRRRLPHVFAGTYRPLVPAGPAAEHLFAFARTTPSEAAIVVVPRLTLALFPDGTAPVGAPWRGTILPLPGSPTPLRNALTGETIVPRGTGLPVDEVLAVFPAALLVPAS